MTAKYDNFVTALKQLCIEHEVLLDFGYEGCKVFDKSEYDAPYLPAAGFSQDIPPQDWTEE